MKWQKTAGIRLERQRNWRKQRDETRMRYFDEKQQNL